MNMAEAGRERELRARVETLERQYADLTRRFDEMSAVFRQLTDSAALAANPSMLRVQKRG